MTLSAPAAGRKTGRRVALLAARAPHDAPVGGARIIEHGRPASFSRTRIYLRVYALRRTPFLAPHDILMRIHTTWRDKALA